MKKISIVIPNWNGVEKLQKNLPKVLSIARKEKIEEVIISDDASTDNSVEVLKAKFPDVVLVERKTNGGFASNVNTGVQNSKSEVVMLLNSDAVPENNFLRPAVAHFENSEVFSVSCNVGGLWSWGKFENGFFWHGQADPGKTDSKKSHQTLWASGGSGLFRRSLWDELGGLDELFNPFYEEDVDLGYRATKRGFKNIWEPESRVEHYKQPGVIAAHFSANIVAKIAQRNQLIFIWKNITSKKLKSEHNAALTKMLVAHPKYWQTFLAAAKFWPKIMEKRKNEQKYAKLTDEEILSKFPSEMLYSN